MKETKKRKGVLIANSILCFLLVIAILVIETQKQTPDIAMLLQTIILSILCSIVASFIFLYIQRGVEKDEVASVSVTLTSIEEKLKKQEMLYDSGIKSIRKKSFYEKKGDFWKKMLKDTNDKLDLSGHSISHWLDDEYKSLFLAKVKTMIRKGKHICILLSNEEGQIDPDIISSGLKQKKIAKKMSKVENTCYELAKMMSTVEEKYRTNLQLFITKRSLITYMYIRTDSQCFISPYISSPVNSQNTFLLELDTGVDYSKCFEEDFKEMLRNLDYIKWE